MQLKAWQKVMEQVRVLVFTVDGFNQYFSGLSTNSRLIQGMEIKYLTLDEGHQVDAPDAVASFEKVQNSPDQFDPLFFEGAGG